MSQTKSNEPIEAAASAIGHLYEAKERLKDAAVAAGTVVKEAAKHAVADGRERIGEPLSDVRQAAGAAVGEVGQAATAEFDVLLDKGKDLLAQAEELIRQRPVAAFGTALAVGWLIAKLTRRH